MQTEDADETNLETQNDSGSGLGEQPDQAKRPRKDGAPQSNAQDIENDSEHLQLQLETITALPVIVVATGFWYFSSSINAVASQRLFRGLLQESTMLLTTDDDDRVIENWGVIVLSVVLTLGQLCAGSLLSLSVLFLLGREPRHSDRIIGCRGNNTNSTSAMPKNQVQELYQQLQWQDFLIGLLHCFGSICTNIGYGYGSASLVQVIKLIEPIQTLLLSALVQKSLQVLSCKKVASTITITSGTYMLLSNPSMEINPKSVIFAIGSGMCLASRNVFSKQRQASNPSTSLKVSSKDGEAKTFREILLKGIKKFAGITVMAAVSNIILALVMVLHSSRLLGTMIPQLLRYSPKILSEVIIFHCLYNMASITVLSLTSAPSHSLLNVGKRIFNVISAAVAFGAPINDVGRVGLLVAAIGACFYNIKISSALNAKISKRSMPFWGIVVLCVYILLQFKLNVASVHPPLQFYDPNSVRARNVSNISRNNKVVLLGPHDRYNFGDLIFAQVVAKLLRTRSGYLEDDILYGGIVSTNMSAYGFPGSVLSMKTIQSLSQRDARQGPYDIIYTGGEAMGCSFECALSMMQTPKLKREAVGERVQGCGYLFAKRLLRNTSFHHSPRHNIAVINSLGGKTSRECEEAVRTADYAAFRDKDPLFPDSAVMIRELFSEQIDGASKVVRAELGTKSHQRLVAVQHRDNKIHEKGKNKDRYTQELASALDQVALQLNATVVFFAAGTAPRHDSFDFYEEISQQMTQPAIVYRAENLWKVVGLVSLADAVFSTSLHVRIMAFVHAKPRVTWCNKKWPLKHANFIRLWDTNSSAPCVVPDHLNQTWDTLQKHYLKDPEKSRTETIQLSQQIVQKYLESFHEFSGLLRPKE